VRQRQRRIEHGTRVAPEDSGGVDESPSGMPPLDDDIPF
jgi:hypothetical protein